MGFWRELGEGLVQIIYPENLYCMACGDLLYEETTGWGLCERCFSKLFSEENLRGTIQKNCNGRSYSQLLACTMYGGLSKDILGKFKNKDQPWLGKYLGRLMAERFLEEGCPADVVTYVPMHAVKRRRRGYDQAQILAEQVARVLSIPCVSYLERMRQTAAMKNMSEAQRRQNVAGAFAWNKNDEDAVPTELLGKHVLLVDDIITTGSTAEACAAVLRKHGAEDVMVLAFAAAAHEGVDEM